MSSPTKPTPGPAGPAERPERPGSALNNNFTRLGEEKQERGITSTIHGHQAHHHLPMPGLSGPPNGPVGNLLKGTVDKDGNLKDASLSVGIKLDLEAEVHLTARVRGDILVGLY
ncbi:hypothetical protein N0V93_008248 [Gnomoniopsis smithogilvyi]|uniref:Uncharacterized protein n=1 Tax=Gnomoniopsis smithogilvyi TaxID=1191159 RepID=A0A9W8YMU6_9PEZI|nr:hypothetical protein N0V93_008248 [Gnomoniopsis smithogilvyi]